MVPLSEIVIFVDNSRTNGQKWTKHFWRILNQVDSNADEKDYNALFMVFYKGNININTSKNSFIRNMHTLCVEFYKVSYKMKCI